MPRSMSRPHGRVLAAALACPGVALASFENRVTATARGIDNEVETNTVPTAALVADRVNTVGGHGYAQLDTDFGSGVVTARTHGCIGPVQPVFSDNANGSAAASANNEPIEPRVDSLGYGAPFTVTLCYSITSDVLGYVSDPVLATGGAAENSFSISIAGQPALPSSRHGYAFETQAFNGTGVFAGAAAQTVTVNGTYSFTAFNGIPFNIGFSLTSQTSTSARGGANLPSLVDGSSGAAMTFGLTSANGARFTWRGAAWTGSCDSSASLVPNNPIPAPSAAATLLLLGGVTRRRRA